MDKEEEHMFCFEWQQRHEWRQLQLYAMFSWSSWFELLEWQQGRQLQQEWHVLFTAMLINYKDIDD
jgi:hypothetical protein